MRKLILAAATALSMSAVPAMAQDADNTPALMSREHQQQIRDMEPDARVYFETLDAEYQEAYFSWDIDAQDYFWTLDEQKRAELFELTAAERDATLAYMASQRTNSDGISFVKNAVVQDIPTTEFAHNQDYPVCESDYDDHCINAWAAGMRGPGVDRPLAYWPGDAARDNGLGG